MTISSLYEEGTVNNHKPENITKIKLQGELSECFLYMSEWSSDMLSELLTFGLEFTGLIKIMVLEAADLQPTSRMTRLDTDILQVSSNRLNPYVMVDILETGARGKSVARHIDKTVAMRGTAP